MRPRRIPEPVTVVKTRQITPAIHISSHRTLFPIAVNVPGTYASAEQPTSCVMLPLAKDPNRLLMQTAHEALAEARDEIIALLEENRELREEIRRLREKKQRP